MTKRVLLALTGCVALLISVAACGEDETNTTATWSLHKPGTAKTENPRITPETTEFIAYVTRAGCSGGFTGKILPPTFKTTSDKVIVTFTVEPLKSGDVTCPSNPTVPFEVALPDGPLGQRELVDAACLANERVAKFAYCRGPDGPGVRYSP